VTTDDSQVWTVVGPVEAITPERGVAALVGDVQVAVFRTFAGCLYAVSNVDPYTGAAVLARGIVGDRGGEPTVASPLHKQVYSLTSGRCFDDDAIALATYPIRLNGGIVEVAVGAPWHPPRVGLGF
jgi:nitrite reductase (NADH) small subunit